MRLYRKKNAQKGSIERNESTEGRPIEMMWKQMKDNPSTGTMTGKEMMYPQEGIPYGTDIRDNKWDQAINQTNKVTKAITAARKRGQERRAEQLEKQAKERAEKANGGERTEGKETGTATSE